MSEPINDKLEFEHPSFSDAMKSKPVFWGGIQDEKTIDTKPEGLSEDNAVKVWLALEARIRDEAFTAEESDWSQSSFCKLHHALVVRFLDMEERRANTIQSKK